ncbi:hypothetical protein GCM10027267_18670 [Paramicrobacterium agarici]
MGIDLEAETDFFQHRVRLVAPSLFGLLRSLVLELAVVHDLGHRRLRIGSYLNKVEVGLLGETKRDVELDNADLLTARPDESNLRNPDTVIGTGIADAELL